MSGGPHPDWEWNEPAQSYLNVKTGGKISAAEYRTLGFDDHEVRYDISGWSWHEPTELFTHRVSGETITREEALRRGVQVAPPRLDRPGLRMGRIGFPGGGVRDEAADKPRYDLLLPMNVPMDRQFLTRVARHMQEGCKKYPERNWEEFSDPEALDRCRQSAFRHFMAWMTGESDGEDHAAAVVFNLMAAEHVRQKLEGI